MSASSWVTPRVIAQRLGVTIKTVRRWIALGRLKAFNKGGDGIGRRLQVREDELARFVEAQELAPA